MQASIILFAAAMVVATGLLPGGPGWAAQGQEAGSGQQSGVPHDAGGASANSPGASSSGVLPGGASTDRALGAAPPGHSLENHPPGIPDKPQSATGSGSSEGQGKARVAPDTNSSSR